MLLLEDWLPQWYQIDCQITLPQPIQLFHMLGLITVDTCELKNLIP